MKFNQNQLKRNFSAANFPDSVVEKLPESFETGIYYGWASVDGGAVHRMVISVGWNPFYHNSKKTMVRTLYTLINSFSITSNVTFTGDAHHASV